MNAILKMMLSIALLLLNSIALIASEQPKPFPGTPPKESPIKPIQPPRPDVTRPVPIDQRPVITRVVVMDDPLGCVRWDPARAAQRGDPYAYTRLRIEGYRFGSREGKGIALAGHGSHVDLRIASWEDRLIIASPASVPRLLPRKSHYIGMEKVDHSGWLSNIDKAVLSCPEKPDLMPLMQVNSYPVSVLITVVNNGAGESGSRRLRLTCRKILTTGTSDCPNTARGLQPDRSRDASESRLYADIPHLAPHATHRVALDLAYDSSLRWPSSRYDFIAEVFLGIEGETNVDNNTVTIPATLP